MFRRKTLIRRLIKAQRSKRKISVRTLATGGQTSGAFYRNATILDVGIDYVEIEKERDRFGKTEIYTRTIPLKEIEHVEFTEPKEKIVPEKTE